MIFKSDDLKALFATMVLNKAPVRLSCLRLIRKDGGFVEAQIPQENKKTGKNYAYAFTKEAIAEYAPSACSFSLQQVAGYRGEPMPILLCFDTPWEPEQQADRLVRAAPQSAEPQGLTRAKG
jgi:hypothetical protein